MNVAKKKLIPLLLSVCIIISQSLPAFASDGSLSIDTAYADETYTNYPGTPVYYDSLASDYSADYNAVVAWCLIPDSVKQLLLEYNTKIYITSTTPEEQTKAGTAYGPTVRYMIDSRQITTVTKDSYVIVRSDCNVTALTLHELGHIVDYLIEIEDGYYDGTAYGVSDTAEWISLFTQYQNVIGSIDSNAGVNVSTATETWATAFRLACEKPEELLNACPEVYYYVTNIIANI